MELTLLNFSKRINSTKKPTAEQLAAGKVFNNLTLKQLTNIDNPNLILAGAKDEDYKFNYAYVKEWDRYYHIKTSDLRHEDIYTAKLELDDLATYKDDILATSAYIVYSSTGYNRWIKDDRFPLLIHGAEYVRSTSQIMANGEPLFISGSNETVLLTTVSKNEGLVTWITTEEGVRAIIDDLTADDTIWGSLTNQFGDAMGSIIQVLRLPINVDALPKSANMEQVYLGNAPLKDSVTGGDVFMYKLTSKVLNASGGISLPVTYTDFRFSEPYCSMKISLPFVGVIDFPISEMSPSGALDWDLSIDLMTGALTYAFKNPDNIYKVVASYSGQCGGLVPITSTQIANASSIFSSIATGSASIGLSVLSGNPAPAVIGGIGSIVQGFYGMNQKSTTVLGSFSGGRSEEITGSRINVVVEKFPTANEPDNITAIEGRPVCKVDTLSNYSGYMKTQGFSIDIAANSDVINSINKKLDAGIYIE